MYKLVNFSFQGLKLIASALNFKVNICIKIITLALASNSGNNYSYTMNGIVFQRQIL